MLKAISDKDCLTAEEVRKVLYQVASESLLAQQALQQVEQLNNGETLLAINSLLHSFKDRLEDIAGGRTFDRLSDLEEGKAVAS